jgi:ATP-binding protein involved in chromosome partitioning
MHFREIILHKLREVIHPEDKRDIVTSGLVKAINVSQQQLEIILRFKSQDRHVIRLLRSNILETLNEYRSNFTITVKFEKVLPITQKIYGAMATIPKLSLQKLAICSPRGGVGQTSLSINLGIALSNLNFRVGLLDLDIYGPDLPSILGLEQEPFYFNKKVFVFEEYGICLMSLKKLMDEETEFNFRESCVERCVQQIMQEIKKENLNLMIFNLPPGSGDAQIALSQCIGFDGIILISNAQDPLKTGLDKMIHLFQDINIPIIGILEDSSSLDQHLESVQTFLDSKNIFDSYGVKYLGKIPIELISRVKLPSLKQPLSDSNHLVKENSLNQIADLIKHDLYQ